MLKSKSKIIYHGERKNPLWLKKERTRFMLSNALFLKGCYTQGKTIDEAFTQHKGSH